MTPVIPRVRMMTYEEAQQERLHSRGLILEHQNRSYILSAGTRDMIHVFTRSIIIYVLTINRTLGYIGLDAYYPPETHPINTIFLHSEYQITETLGPEWKIYSPGTIAQRLIDYLI